MRFGEHNVLCPKYVDVYQFRWVWGLGGRTWSTVHFLFILKKTEKVQEQDLYLSKILHFDLQKFFLG